MEPSLAVQGRIPRCPERQARAVANRGCARVCLHTGSCALGNMSITFCGPPFCVRLAGCERVWLRSTVCLHSSFYYQVLVLCTQLPVPELCACKPISPRICCFNFVRQACNNMQRAEVLSGAMSMPDVLEWGRSRAVQAGAGANAWKRSALLLGAIMHGAVHPHRLPGRAAPVRLPQSLQPGRFWNCQGRAGAEPRCWGEAFMLSRHT